jgi:predicted dinucleotide-binding enzyme
MKVTIIGTGRMGHAIGSRALAGGHEIDFIGTHISKARELADEMVGEGSVGASEKVEAEIVVLAVPYTEAPHVVRQHAGQLRGTVIVDPTNPVDFSIVEPLDRDWIGAFGSGAELIAAEAPDAAAFVKAFNTNFAGPLLVGEVGGQPLDVFVAGDDEEAKRKVMQLIGDGGMRAIDAGRLARARELEATALLHMEIQGALDARYASAIKVLTPRSQASRRGRHSGAELGTVEPRASARSQALET